MLMNVIGQAGWVAAFPGLLYVMVVFTSQAYVLIFVPFLLYSLYRAVTQISYFSWAARMRCILQQYPWQIMKEIPRGLAKHPEATDEAAWFEFRDPDHRERKVPLLFIRHQRAHWWLKRIGNVRTKPALKAEIEPLWFAGDPRFLGVIAASTAGADEPRRLHVLYQRPVFDSRRPLDTRGAGIADVDRARRAGARYLDGASQSPA
ncbi:MULTISPECIES: hypothetical protein [unclassified Streptomyces]|uniref:hypothetical protein n=1 Tax=unclassified Streptomyces TaxID=2593676 RepID=UPI00224CBCBD|nr:MULTISPECIES: hypothetical protein [unclassified Streptomyces]MCX4990580.1 hypothetical protein [Streptomyces sp. NBC_00568]MCX5004189.1 hypothetical protein [Streptomyces sp. NBC_00638]